jgi:NADPH:quinone reductase
MNLSVNRAESAGPEPGNFLPLNDRSAEKQKTMKAWILNQTNTDELLQLQEVDAPVCRPHEVKIRMMAASLNPVDYKLTRGAFGLPLPRVVGIDAAGIITEVGAEAGNWRVGDPVFGLVDIFSTGSFAEYVCLDGRAASSLPYGLSFEAASTLPCAGITAWQAIWSRLPLQSGQRVFISAGGGAVGGFAIQLAKMKGAEVITSASKHFDRIRTLGADHIVDYKNEQVADRVKEITAGEGVEHVIDAVSGVSAAQHCELVRYGGSLTCVAGRPKEYPLPPFTRAVSIAEIALGAVYRHGDPRSLAEISAAGRFLATLMVEKKLNPMISRTIGFGEIPEGLRAVSRFEANGKIVVRFD